MSVLCTSLFIVSVGPGAGHRGSCQCLLIDNLISICSDLGRNYNQDKEIGRGQ